MDDKQQIEAVTRLMETRIQEIEREYNSLSYFLSMEDFDDLGR